jgi:DNA-binding transcriptional LysR family regulator
VDWYLLRYFLAVAKLGNFSKAAATVNVTQPTLSAGIIKLETQLGHRLFERDQRRVSLTPAGSRFLTHAERISHNYEIALRDIADAPKRRSLRVGVLATIPTQTIEAIVGGHMLQAGADNLEIIDGNERDLKGKLEDDAIDIALTILRPGTARFEKESLCSEDYVLVVSRHHRLAHLQSVGGQELAEDVMIIRRHCEALAATSRYFTQRGVRPRFGLKTMNDDRAIAMVRAGLPNSFCDPNIRQIKLDDFELRREIGLVFGTRNPSMTGAASIFLKTVRQIIRQQNNDPSARLNDARSNSDNLE